MLNGCFKSIILIIFLCTPALLFSDYPEIESFNSLADPNFRQLQEELEMLAPVVARWESGARDESTKEIILSHLQFYKYRIKEGETLFSLAADLMLNSDSIASINGIENPLFLATGTELIIPNIPGIFCIGQSRNQLDRLLKQSERSSSDSLEIRILQPNNSELFFFYPGERFSRDERYFFINRPFQSPLPYFIMGSPYGYRNDPFSGNWLLHHGIDLNVPKGISVKPIKDGIVTEIGELEIYGLYIIIRHEGGYSSLYGHLDKILVSANQRVTVNQIIGETGNSGRSTGPHLHLELRLNGETIDPVPLIRQ